MIAEAHEKARKLYSSSLGRKRSELVTPSLILDLEFLRENLALMNKLMKYKPAKLRAHMKVHKSPHIARMEIEAGAIGIGTATIWEALVMARAGIQDVFIVNQVVGKEKIRTAALLARDISLKVAVDNLTNVEALSGAAQQASSEIGCIIEVDTGMRRSGVESPEEAFNLASKIIGLRGLRFEGLTGYEGNCSLEMHKAKREYMARKAMDYFVSVADNLIKNRISCPILSAGGTATWEITASNPRITEIQPGSYASMDGYHARLEPRFKQATSVLATVISRRSDHIVTDAGKKTVGASEAILKDYDYPVQRYDEEHGIFAIYDPCPLNTGDTVELLPGYTPFAVNYFDAYHVVENGEVVDIWPILPRGPEDGGLLNDFYKLNAEGRHYS
jgi:D-serine deaminase-like pyridoxal phosphate-dependent protein